MISSNYSGISLSKPPMNISSQIPIKSDLVGWSKKSTIRNRNFLQSVITSKISGYGVSITLTLKTCPPNSSDFALLLKTYLKRLYRLKMIRYHWVIEWQRRGVPHVHMTAYFPIKFTKPQLYSLKNHWQEIAQAYSPNIRSQHAVNITDIKGWLEYTAKHGSRGASNYQRHTLNIPKEWQKKTGRIWGKGGFWELSEPLVIPQTDEQFYRYRRILRSWRKADARQTPLRILVDANGTYMWDERMLEISRHFRSYKRRKRIISARGCLKSNDRSKSSVRGMNEWLPLHLQMKIYKYLFVNYPIDND